MAEIELPKPEDAKEAAKDRFTKKVALTVAVYAVALAFAALGGGNCMKETMLNQQQASNEWARYQAKTIRRHLYDLERQKLSIELIGVTNPEILKAKQDLLDKMKSEIVRFEVDNKEIEEKARGHEAVRDRAMKQDPYFDFAEVLLQIAIVCASVAMLAGSRPMFAISLAIAACGIFLTVNGFTLLVKVPFLAE